MAVRYRSAGVEHARNSNLLMPNDQEFGHDYSSQLERLFTDSVYLAEPWHTDEFLSAMESKEYQATWRLKERMKTVGVALVVCLNLGTDPPDVVKPNPCARKECWIDPVGSKQKNLEIIGHELQHQYEKWQSKAKYKQCLDPTSEDLRRVCLNLRKVARNERLLLHYNGHGVPLPTKNGELWVFGKHYTHYMPVAIFELRSWLGEPAIYVLDCSRAGILLPHFVDPQQLNSSVKFSNDLQNGTLNLAQSGKDYGTAYNKDGPSPIRASSKMKGSSTNLSNLPQDTQSFNADKRYSAMSDFYNGMEGQTIVLAACRSDEILPLSPLYPADVFTSCLTTPLTMALRWFILENPYSMSDVSPELAENIPGKDNDRKTPRGELNWIFTAITDTIAWTTLPPTTFQRMFRQDLLVASLFRNFLLAKRIMKSMNCCPQSWPPMSDSSSHPLWQAWDLATEACLSHVVFMQRGSMMVDPRNNMSLPVAAASSSALKEKEKEKESDLGDKDSGPSTGQSAFFTDSLTAFEIWLDFGGGKKAHEAPMHLPILLQVLLSQTHRLHALLLLRRYLSLGPDAVNSALLVGIFPYILKLLQSPAVEIRHVLVCIWASVLGFDRSCRVELVRDKSQLYFIQYLSNKDHPLAQRCMAAFILSEICFEYGEGQQTCLQLGLHRICVSVLDQPEVATAPLLKRWICLCLCKYCESFGWAKYVCLTEGLHDRLYPLLEDSDPTVRAAVNLALGEMFGASDPGYGTDPNASYSTESAASVGGPVLQPHQQQLLREQEQRLAMQLLESCSDGSVLVRKEALCALGKFFALPIHASSLRHIALQLIKHSSNPKTPWILAPDLMRVVTDSLAEHLERLESFGSAGKQDSAAADSRPRRVVSPRVQQNIISTETNSVDDGAPCIEDATPDQSSHALQKTYVSAAPTAQPVIATSAQLDMPDHNTEQQSVESRNSLLAAAYLSLWLTLVEVQCRDPHFEVRRSAAGLISWVRSSVTTSSDIIAPTIAPLRQNKLSGLGPLVGSSLDDKKLQSEGQEVTGSSGSDLPMPIPAPMTPNRRPINMAPAPPTLSPMGIVSASRSPSGSLSRAFSFGPRPDVVPGASVGPSTFMFPLMPLEDACLISHLYSSFRSMFLMPDEGFDAADDSLGELGGERLYRDNQLKEILTTERRLKSILQDSNYSSAETSVAQSPVVGSHDLTNLYDAPVVQFDDKRQSANVGDKDKRAIKFEQRAILNIDNAEITSHVMFHAFLDILAVSDGKSVGIWSLDTGHRIMQINHPCDPLHAQREHANRQAGPSGSAKLKSTSAKKPSAVVNPVTAGRDTVASSSNAVVEKFEATDTRITSMTWINESFDALLALGADNGTVSIWRDTSTSKYSAGAGERNNSVKAGSAESKWNTCNESTSLASAFVALPDVAETSRGSGVVMSWQQHSGTMVVGGNSSTIRLWDLGREQCVRVFATGVETCTTALASKTVAPLGAGAGVPQNPHSLGDEHNLSWTFAGFADGSIAVFDERVQGTGKVSSAREHSAWIVAAHFRPDVPEVITGSVRGSVKFWDLRTMRSFKTLEVHKSPLTALAVHPCAPIMATGSHAQFIKMLTLGGEQLGGIIKYHDGFLGQRIGPVSCLAFHPTKVLLAAGATDSIVSIYGEKKAE